LLKLVRDAAKKELPMEKIRDKIDGDK
jgi:hypothetical protein